MECKECGGILDIKRRYLLRTGCDCFAGTYPCAACGRLHLEGLPVSTRQGQKCYLSGDQLVLMDSENSR